MEGKWAVGDKCLAPFSGDETLYRAVIRKIEKDGDGRWKAEVWYKGFSSEENEFVYWDDLKEVTKSKKSHEKSRSEEPAFESPLLNYISEEDRIRAQYADMYDEPRAKSRPSCSTPGTKTTTPKGAKVTAATRKRKGIVAIGGDVKSSPQIAKSSPKSGSIDDQRKFSQPGTQSSNVQRTSEEDWSIADLEEGFSAKDVEKPYFPGKSDMSTKEPLVLSSPHRKPVIQVPATINRYLREYQREGIQFIYSHYKNNEGALLGDDMGLGKTVQVIAFIAAVLCKTGGKEDLERRLPEFLQKESPQKSTAQPKIFLIICPNSVLYNWLDEFETWTHCIVARYHGKERDDTLRKARRGRLDAVLTTYETYRLYLDDLLTVSWDAVFVDEVHKIKEPSALITQSLQDINTNRRYGLTGTALQNKLGELWCVLDWANPGCLGEWGEFRQEYEKVITTGQKYNASKRELADARKVAKRFASLRSKWMIRRTKALIAHQLPSKDENVVFCNLSSFQLDVYRALLESDDMKLVLEQRNPCDCRSGRKRGRCCYKRNDRGEGIKSLTFGLMSLLIKVSNHIALLMPDVSKSKKQREKALRYCEIAFAKQPQFVELSREARFATLSDPTYCGKMQVLEKLLRVFKRENNKVLLFSCYTQLLDILEMFMKTTSYTYRRLDGKTPAQDRQKFVHEFNRDPDIFLFLISTKAGGIGLNLTGANVVIIFDPNWNPTYDLQAQDRAYRIGQHRDVRVYRLISRGSIEENMYLRQVYKQQLASVAVTTENAKRYFTAVAGDKEQQGEIFGLQNLFALRVDGSCLTKDVIQREEKTELGISVAKYQPQAPVEEDIDDPLHEFLHEEDGDGESRQTKEDVEEDEDDYHGIASQLSEIDDEDDDIDEHSEEEVESRSDSNKPFASTSKSYLSVKKQAENDAISKDKGDGWRDQLRRLTRGKGILSKDGRLVQKVKGQGKRGSAPPGITNETAMASSRDQEEDKEDENGKEEMLRGSRRKEDGRQIQKMDSGNIKTAEDVFKKCGIEYVHSNQRVVGASRIEDHVSKVAQRDVFEIGQFSQEPAYCQVPTLEMEPVERQPKPKPAQKQASSISRGPMNATSHRLGDTTLLIGQTPLGVRKDQFKDMAAILDFKNPSALAHHIEGLSDEACRELLLAYHQSKQGADFGEYIKLPPKSFMDSKSEEGSSSGRVRDMLQKQGLNQTLSGGRGRGRGHVRGKGRGRKKEHRAKSWESAPLSRRRKAPSELKFESSSSDDGGSMLIDSDDVEEPDPPLKEKKGSYRRRKYGNYDGWERRERRKRSGMISHEVYKEIFDDSFSDEDDLPLNATVIQKRGAEYKNGKDDILEYSRKWNKVLKVMDEKDGKVSRMTEERNQNSGEAAQDGSTTILPARPKKDESLSFLDDIFLSDTSKPRRRPPPKKHVGRRDKSATTTTSESDSIFGFETITDNSMDQQHCLSKADLHLKYIDDKASGSAIITKSRVTSSFEIDVITETVSDEHADLWKRNETFVPHPPCFDQSEDSDESQSLFVANPRFKSGSGAIT